MSSLSDQKLTANVTLGVIDSNQLDTIISPSGKIIHIDQEVAHVDQALLFAEQHGHVEVSKEEDNKLRRKLDCIVLPLFCFLYMVQFMDKTCISFASVMGIQVDYEMKGEMYSWTNSGFYLGYLFGSPFAAIACQKLPTIKFISCVIVLWGTVQCLHCTAHNYSTFMFLRVFLGFLEAFVSPIFVIILNQYYHYSEHFGRTGCFYGFNGVGTIFLSSVSYALYNNKDSYAIRSYRILFLIIGLMTIALGFIIMLVMPNKPTDAKWLTEREKEVVINRIRSNNQGFGNKTFKWEQAREVFEDPRTLIYFLLSLSVAIPNGGISGFGTIMLKSFGYSTSMSLLMKMPVGAVELVSLVGLPLFTIITPKRMPVAISYMLVVLMGTCLLAFATKVDVNAALAGYFINGASPVGIILITSCVTSNTAGFTKKMMTNAVTLMGYSAGNVIGPQTFRSTDAPNYLNAKAGAVGCYCAAIFLMCVLTAYNIWENRRRDRLRNEMGDAYLVPDNLEFKDLTDFQNPEFRYRI